MNSDRSINEYGGGVQIWGTWALWMGYLAATPTNVRNQFPRFNSILAYCLHRVGGLF